MYSSRKAFLCLGVFLSVFVVQNIRSASFVNTLINGVTRTLSLRKHDNAKTQVCLGILAYQGVRTLDNTLVSYQKSGLLDASEQAYILFQELDSLGRQAWARNVVAAYPKLKPIYEKKNIDFQGFYKLLDACSSSKYVLLLEEDFPVSSSIKNVLPQLENGIFMLNHGANAVRMRSRREPGNPNYSYLTWKNTGKIESSHLISHVMWDDEAEIHIPEIRVCREHPKTWCASSKHAHYTNNPVLYRTAFAKKMFYRVPPKSRSFSKFEPWLTVWWKEQDFNVAYSDALFSHRRMDRTIGITKLDTEGAKTIECRSEAQEWREKNGIKEDMRCSITFEKLNKWSKNIGIPYILGYGSLLGWYRQCSCIPTSTDVDIFFSYDDVKDHIRELAEVGQILWVDQDQKYPRVVKIRKFGMHVDAFVAYHSDWLGKTWIVDGDEATILNYWDPRNYSISLLHGVPIRLPPVEVISQVLYELYGDTWNQIPKQRWETISSSASKKLRLKIFGSNHIIDVLNKRTTKMHSSEWGDDPLRVILPAHGYCLESNERTECINRFYTGTRGGANEAYPISLPPSTKLSFAHEIQDYFSMRRHWHRIALVAIGNIASKLGLPWSLRGGSVIAPARYGDWGFISSKFVDVTDFDVDVAVYFDSQEQKGIVCPKLMERLKATLKREAPDASVTSAGCHFKFEIDQKWTRFKFLQGLSYTPVVNVGVDPVVKHSGGQWCHQDGSYCIPGNVIFPLVKFQMSGTNVFLPALLYRYTKATEAYNQKTKSIKCVAVPYVTVLRDKWFEYRKDFEKQFSHAQSKMNVQHDCAYLKMVYDYARNAQERGDPNFWDAWQGKECNTVRTRVTTECANKQ